jgi:hypothetical protein
MDGQAKVLEQGIEVTSLQRYREDAVEGVGGQQHKEQKANPHHAHDGQHPGHDLEWQIAAEGRDSGAPGGQKGRPEQQGALVGTPNRRDLKEGRHQGVGITGDIDDGEVVGQEGLHQESKGDGGKDELAPGQGAGHIHPVAVAPVGAHQGYRGLDQGQAQRQDQGKVTKFRDHWRSPPEARPGWSRLGSSRAVVLAGLVS